MFRKSLIIASAIFKLSLGAVTALAFIAFVFGTIGMVPGGMIFAAAVSGLVALMAFALATITVWEAYDEFTMPEWCR